MERTKPASQKGRLNGIGGHIEVYETPIDAMSREAFEELDLEGELDWTPAGVFYGKDWRVFVFWANFDGPVEPAEEQKLEWHDRNELPYNAMYNLRWLIPMCKENLRFSINEEADE